eukprot:s6517_g7.t1
MELAGEDDFLGADDVPRPTEEMIIDLEVFCCHQSQEPNAEMELAGEDDFLGADDVPRPTEEMIIDLEVEDSDIDQCDGHIS